MYPGRGIQARKCESENHSSKSSLKLRLSPKCTNTIMPLGQSNAILRQPRAKIIASQLHYTMILVATDNLR